jgi:peroxiredoxin Q/BCP
MTKIVEGGKAPEFEMEGAAGPIRSADFKGKTYVLYFYPKDDTPGCTNENKDFSALAPEFAKAGVALVGASNADFYS